MEKRKNIKYSNEPSPNLMACPFCGFEYNHIIDFEHFKGNDNYESGVDGIRGDSLILYCSCENGHEYKIIFGEHKGYVFLFAEKGTR